MNKPRKKSKIDSVVGTYVYDRKLGRLVKISDRIPGLSSRRDSGAAEGPCGEGSCDTGPCGRGMCGS